MTARRGTSGFILILVLLFANSSGLSADTIDSHITAVTVYPDRAVVTRSTSGQFTAGEHALTFENLPKELVEQSLQASGFGIPGATILDVTTQNVFAETTANERVKAIEDQIKGLQDRRRVLDDRSKTLEEQRQFLHGVLASATSTTGNLGPRPSLEELQRISTYSEEAMERISGEQRTTDAQRNDIQAKQSALERQLNELRNARGRQSKSVTVRMALTTPGRLEVALRYSIPNASWTPAYDARFHNADRAVDLSYFGVVRNGTGEDWKDIVLTLSTARPSLGGAPAELRPWITEVQRARSPASAGSSTFASTMINPDLVGEVRLMTAPVDAELGRGNGQIQTTTRDLPMVGNNVLDLQAVSPGLSGRAATPAPPPQASAVLSTAGIESTITSATFKIPGTVSIPGNSVNQKIAIKQTRFAATLQYQSTPRVLEAAFLNASASNNTDYPLLAGSMNTFLDDTFVTTSSLKSVMPGEKFDLALGVDDGISVKRRIVNRFTEDTGLTNKTRRITYEISVTLTNNKTTTERVMFKELTPVSHDEKIVVKLQSPQEKEVGTATNPREITREEDGRLVWRISLKPGEKREFVLKVSVEHPSDLAVTGLD